MTFRESEQKILKALLGQDRQSKTGIMWATRLSYHCVRQNIMSLESKGLVRVEKTSGKEDRVSLTREGRKVARFFSDN